jgi:hypothetical protein
MISEYADCVKKGPYLPLGETEWECTTHDRELHLMVKLSTGQSPKRDDMNCAIGDASVMTRGHRLWCHVWRARLYTEDLVCNCFMW